MTRGLFSITDFYNAAGMLLSIALMRPAAAGSQTLLTCQRRNDMLRYTAARIRFGHLFLVIAGFGVLPSASAQKTAHIDSPIASPIFVNVYWDSNWDTDNPGMKKASLDAITQAITNSSYFKGLSEYGVTGASFAGGFLPEPACPKIAPNNVGFYDPVNTSIAGFVQCEHDNGPAILRQNSVIYNVLLPPSSVESDFWSSNFCSGAGSPAAWHYHGLEDSFPFFNGPPIYTIVMSNARCGGTSTLVPTLTHEMVEATTDPFPIDISIIPPHISIQTENEIADFCKGQDVPIFINASNQTPLFTQISATTYWSNAMQKCVSFTDTTTPSLTTVTIANWGSQTLVAASGSGFGAMPGQISLPSPALPYIEVVDRAHGWAAGDAINGDSAQVNIPNWSNTLVNGAGFVSSGAMVNNVPGAPLQAWICNPNSLRCSSAATTAAPGPYNPRLLVLDIVAGDFVGQADTFAVLNGATTLTSNTVSSNCQSACVFQTLQTFTPGPYVITQKVTGSGVVKTVANTCSQVTLSLGEETSCRISNSGPSDPNSGCPVNFKCCEPGTNKCSKCVPSKTACP
jgi:hypothetical protein